MRCWHYKLLPYLPKSQLLAQWRELNSIFKKQDKHILINYVYEYEKQDLYNYSIMLYGEFKKRGYNMNINNDFVEYFKKEIGNEKVEPCAFKRHHTKQYLLQNFMNLEEKYFCGQKDFGRETYLKLWNFVNDELNGLLETIGKELKEDN